MSTPRIVQASRRSEKAEAVGGRTHTSACCEDLQDNEDIGRELGVSTICPIPRIYAREMAK